MKLDEEDIVEFCMILDSFSPDHPLALDYLYILRILIHQHSDFLVALLNLGCLAPVVSKYLNHEGGQNIALQMTEVIYSTGSVHADHLTSQNELLIPVFELVHNSNDEIMSSAVKVLFKYTYRMVGLNCLDGEVATQALSALYEILNKVQDRNFSVATDIATGKPTNTLT